MKIDNELQPALKRLKKPLSFFVELRAGEFIEAKVISFYNNRFYIEFSDGYRDIFYFPKEGSLSMSDYDFGDVSLLYPENIKASSRYANALQNDLQMLCNITGNEGLFTFTFELEEKPSNILVRSSVDGDEIRYSVYANGDYHFSIIRLNGKWAPEQRRAIEAGPAEIIEDLLLETIQQVMKRNGSKSSIE